MPEFKLDLLDERIVLGLIAIAFIALLLFSIRHWQKTKLILLCFGAMWIFGALYNWYETYQHEQASRTILTVNDIDWLWTGIEADETLAPSEWLFTGQLHNKSQYDITSITIDITIYTCLSGWTNCEETAQIEDLELEADIPANHTHSINRPINFRLNELNENWKWTVRTKSARARLER